MLVIDDDLRRNFLIISQGSFPLAFNSPELYLIDIPRLGHQVVQFGRAAEQVSEKVPSIISGLLAGRIARMGKPFTMLFPLQLIRDGIFDQAFFVCHIDIDVFAARVCTVGLQLACVYVGAVA